MTEVAIIGCGPAGMLAAHAVARAGHTPVLYSDKAEPSPITGGVYLHTPIPEVAHAQPDGHVLFVKVGEEAVYGAKVYGDAGARTSWRRFASGRRPAWALRPVYEQLWGLYGLAVRPLAVDHDVAAGLAAEYQLVMSSAPAPSLCQRHGANAVPVHRFPERRVWYVDHAPPQIKDNTMVYNGISGDPWFRSSRVFGVAVTEYPDWIPHARLGRKVLPTTCTCHPQIMRIGRWGQWTPGVLLHHAYQRAEEIMGEVGHAV
jgi:hypothetical protein